VRWVAQSGRHYRVLRQDIASRNDGFYTQGEYDIAPLLRAKPDYNFVELGRSCVLKPYRNKRTLELLWQGVWGYVREHAGSVMIGCGSFPGTDPSLHAQTLSYLHHTSLAPAEWRVRAHEHLRVDMNMLPKDAINTRAAIRALPPLIKGYLRVGAAWRRCRDDQQFGMTDVPAWRPER
jgi:putative hemolysin